MKTTSLFLALFAVGLLGSGCSTDEICNRACDAWAQNGCWDRDTCMSECDDDGDWSDAYADCCEDNAGDCVDLETICG